ncbi:rRNA-binding ribosome biosynthesis protein utp25 [Malassezia psittaci]|uniref:U3 small nucleolar RNA-associated protein 25 n=1 Tax=Malassezia psittaci TaxID=1821823 RepID=A0AAF0F9T1_9BASI|nr:rRNA-binding ribosome biosynthesis protein utp25 [Malassezia psittaci]
MGADNQAHVRLQTLLNVAAAHPRSEDESLVRSKRAKISGRPVQAERRPKVRASTADESEGLDELQAAGSDDDTEEDSDAFHVHFNAEGKELQGIDTNDLHWARAEPIAMAGGLSASIIRAERHRQYETSARRIWNAFKSKSGSIALEQRRLVDLVGRYIDFWDANLMLEQHEAMRSVLAMHTMSHVARTRQRILKNNERLAKAAAAARESDNDDELPELRDQGFTRPKVLVLVPFRNSAKSWVQKWIQVSACEQVEQKSRFLSEFSLPPNAVDKLSDPKFANQYAEDHRKTFSGNIDDNFKMGVKLTRKTLKLYSAFFDSDLIIASPLGLRLMIEKERYVYSDLSSEFDYLSSIECLVVDQMDVMLMQNWDHVKFVMDCINTIPKQAHDTDFSRVMPWYLDDQAKNLRQTVLLSSFDAPEFRSLFQGLRNVAGKIRTTRTYAAEDATMASVIPGVRQTFQKFECANAQGEADARFSAFTTKLLPHLERSAVSATHTMIVIPSYFDFVRIEDYFRKQENNSYATLSEYSSNKEVSRARQGFFSGKKALLLVTERFHFYRRYTIRGARTVIFYGLPDHANYYPELINATLSQRAEDEEILDPAEISVQVLYNKYDLLRLERVVGTKQARLMVTEARPTWRFT